MADEPRKLSCPALEKIPAALARIVEAGSLSGVVTLIWKDGDLAQVNTLGYRDVAAHAPMQRDTIFQIASMTKPIVSTLALMLMERNLLKLDDRISRWLPEFAALRVLRAADGPLTDCHPESYELTVENLMSHRSGIGYPFTSAGPIKAAYEANAPQALAPQAWLEKISSLPLIHRPGERFHYGYSTDILGLLISRLMGKSLGALLKDWIFDPLNMHDTGFWCPPEKSHRLAKLYTLDPADDRLVESASSDLSKPVAFESAGGGLVSTADDYLTFARLLLGAGQVDGVRLLRPESVALLTQNRLSPEQRRIPFMGIPFWLGQGFGLGVSVITDAKKMAWMGAGTNGAFGWPGAYGTWWQVDPAENMVLIYLVQNAMPLTGDTASQLATGQRAGARSALPTFQKLAYASLE